MEPVPAPSPGPSRSFKEELLCAVCYDPFRDAVTLRCGHNFCRGCVTRCWEVQVAPTCPVCKDRAAPADLRTNHTLNNLVEKLLREEAEGARWTGHRSPRLCRLHRGPFNLFCLDDKELLCCSCQADPRHQGHRVQPVKDTAHDFRAKCRNMEHALREKAKAFWAMRRSYEAIAKHNQVEAAWLEGRIRQEFDKLREFLRVEEQAILDAMAEETRQKQLLAEEKMKQLAEDTEALAHEIERLQMEMKEDDVSFLMKHKSRKRRLFCTMEPEPVQPSMLIDVCKYLDSLQYRVWRKMVMSVESVPFSFDPNTAAGWLSVSDDLTSVTNNGYRVQGVEGDHCVTSDPATSPLVPAIPRRLRVELECEEGELSFYDAERHCHLYTFHARFGEVRPYFYLGGTRGDGPPEPLRICPLRITVKEELDG
ncbi:tripartite motif-containing protein 35 isoform X2 [Rousettus aegyptiacus]|uniref:tripartite motif-containing protein 35 isoform X2 n=1 Tax=Rousettus aegyptiacus TaxID=9407 RepID=UPI0007881942|nr:tripartite motif-containing protein 35 isoform X2 [Rousettus aegyptiacus]